MIRRLNYTNPDKETLSLAQAQEYAQSLESASLHSIWKEKYSILEQTYEIRKEHCKENNAAAPGAGPGKMEDQSVQEANIQVLVGPHKPTYSSEIDVDIDKTDSGPKVKPFIKLTLRYKSAEKAKQMEVLFKANFDKLLKLIGEE
jgi:hypothetical protein